MYSALMIVPEKTSKPATVRMKERSFIVDWNYVLRVDSSGTPHGVNVKRVREIENLRIGAVDKPESRASFARG